MIISHHKKFIFIHIYKNAGSSVKHALANYNYYDLKTAGWMDKLRYISGNYPKIFSSQFPGHITCENLKEIIPAKVFNNYLKFAIVRNPFDWQVSLYNYALKDPRHHEHELTKSFKSFDKYLEWRIDGNFSLQSDFIYSKDGELLVDEILKFENLDVDFKRVLKKLDIREEIILPQHNQSSDKPYRAYYKGFSENSVIDTFKEDFENLDYSTSL